jgi:hypothetical protein
LLVAVDRRVSTADLLSLKMRLDRPSAQDEALITSTLWDVTGLEKAST